MASDSLGATPPCDRLLARIASKTKRLDVAAPPVQAAKACLSRQSAARNEGQASCILRDAEVHSLTREMVELRMKPVFEKAAEVLAERLDERQRALLGVAMDFACYRLLSAS